MIKNVKASAVADAWEWVRDAKYCSEISSDAIKRAAEIYARDKHKITNDADSDTYIQTFISTAQREINAMRSEELEKTINELHGWMLNENYGFNELVFRLLASMPGGEDFAESFSESELFKLGWREVDLLAKLLTTIDDPGDVRRIIDVLTRNSETTAEEESN